MYKLMAIKHDATLVTKFPLIGRDWKSVSVYTCYIIIWKIGTSLS